MTYDDYYRELYALNLKINRIEAELSQTELAEVLGVPQSMIARYESGKVLPEMATMNKIAKALNTKTRYFFDDEFIFNIKDTELGTKYEFTNTAEGIEVPTLIGFDISSMFDLLSEKNKRVAIMFVDALVKDENKDEYLKQRFEVKKEEFNAAKEAQKENKKLKKLQKIKKYKRDNNLFEEYEDPYKEELEEYCKEQNITLADYWEQRDKELADLAKEHNGIAGELVKDTNGKLIMVAKEK